MFPPSFSVTIDLRFAAKFLLAIAVTITFTSWSKLNNRPVESTAAGKAAFSVAITNHTLKLNGKNIAYRAKAGYLGIGDAKEKNQANIFYTAYSVGNNSNAAKRPVTFVFNGGPGSAAIWLHMGSFGPVRVGEDGKVVDNANSWLGFTDLVFIDPVGTGYSRPADGVEAREFYGYREDIRSIAAFIRGYLAENNREADPVFLAGESYGGLRAAGLAEELQTNSRLKLAGITLISPALNYQLISFKAGNETPYAYYLPTYALTARYHNRLSSDLQKLTPEQLTARATAFGQETYTKFLNLGDAASDSLAGQVIDSLHYFTGLSKAYLTKINGRVTDGDFTNALLGGSKEIVGTFDGRIKGTGRNTDPSSVALRKLFAPAFQQYIREGLQYNNQLPYLATTATNGWNYGQEGSNSFVNASATLKKVMARNPHLKVNVVGGYYDLATPVATTNYVLNHLGLEKTLSGNVSVKYYPAGHMFYTSDAANAGFRSDSELFYDKALAANN